MKNTSSGPITLRDSRMAGSLGKGTMEAERRVAINKFACHTVTIGVFSRKSQFISLHFHKSMIARYKNQSPIMMRIYPGGRDGNYAFHRSNDTAAEIRVPRQYTGSRLSMISLVISDMFSSLWSTRSLIPDLMRSKSGP